MGRLIWIAMAVVICAVATVLLVGTSKDWFAGNDRAPEPPPPLVGEQNHTDDHGNPLDWGSGEEIFMEEFHRVPVWTVPTLTIVENESGMKAILTARFTVNAAPDRDVENIEFLLDNKHWSQFSGLLSENNTYTTELAREISCPGKHVVSGKINYRKIVSGPHEEPGVAIRNMEGHILYIDLPPQLMKFDYRLESIDEAYSGALKKYKLVVDYEASLVEGGDRPRERRFLGGLLLSNYDPTITRVVLKGNGKVWQSSPQLPETPYGQTYEGEVIAGQTYSVEVVVSGEHGSSYTYVKEIEIPLETYELEVVCNPGGDVDLWSIRGHYVVKSGKSGKGPVVADTEVTLTAIPYENQGYVFVRWTGDTESIVEGKATDKKIVIRVDADKKMVATFAKAPPDATPATEPPVTAPPSSAPPTSAPSTTEPPAGQEVACVLSFAHVAPNEYSEVYLDISGSPGASVNVTLSGPGVVGTARQTGILGADGTLRLTWRINRYGSYSMSGTVGGVSVKASVLVE